MTICNRTIPHVMREAEFEAWHASNPDDVAVRLAAAMDIDYSALFELPKETQTAIAFVSFGEAICLAENLVPDRAEIARVEAAAVAENLARRRAGYNEHIHYSALRAAGCRVEPVIEFHPIPPECFGEHSPTPDCSGGKGGGRDRPAAADVSHNPQHDNTGIASPHSGPVAGEVHSPEEVGE